MIEEADDILCSIQGENVIIRIEDKYVSLNIEEVQTMVFVLTTILQELSQQQRTLH